MNGIGIRPSRAPADAAHRSVGDGLGRWDGWDGTRPDWTDIDAWRVHERDAGGDHGRLRQVAAAWAAAAGGAASGSALVLPKLPNCMALAEMKALAQGAGLEVRERSQ